MKYIKEYRIFESNDLDDVIKNVRDILLPIADMGYEPKVTMEPDFLDSEEILIRVVRYNEEPLSIDEFRSDFDSLYEYLVSEDYAVEVKYVLYEEDLPTYVITDSYKVFASKWFGMNMKVSNLIFITDK